MLARVITEGWGQADERSKALTQQAAVYFRKQWQVTNSPSNQDETIFVRMARKSDRRLENGIVKK